jgi:hypothetical protein
MHDFFQTLGGEVWGKWIRIYAHGSREHVVDVCENLSFKSHILEKLIVLSFWADLKFAILKAS